MTDYLSHLIARERQAMPMVKPRPVARFESPTPAAHEAAVPTALSRTETAPSSPLTMQRFPVPPLAATHPRFDRSASPSEVTLPPGPALSSSPSSEQSNSLTTAPGSLPLTPRPVPIDQPRVTETTMLPPPGLLLSPRSRVQSLPSSPSPPTSVSKIHTVEERMIERQVLLPAPPVKESEIHTVEERMIERQVLLPAPPVKESVTPEQEGAVAIAQSPQSPLQTPVSLRLSPAEANFLEPPPAQSGPPIRPRISLREAGFQERRSLVADTGAPEPTVNVTIGRIEIKAQPPAKAARQSSSTPAPVMSLDTYLQMRAGGQL